MAEIFGIEKLFSHVPRKRLGPFAKYGTCQYGFGSYGNDDIFAIFFEYGHGAYGKEIYGNILLLSGIYRTDNVSGYTRYYREPYYITKNPRYENQQIWRGVFADAVVEWQALTPEQKEEYNQRASYRNLSGYNLFLKEYLLSH